MRYDDYKERGRCDAIDITIAIDSIKVRSLAVSILNIDSKLCETPPPDPWPRKPGKNHQFIVREAWAPPYPRKHRDIMSVLRTASAELGRIMNELIDSLRYR